MITTSGRLRTLARLSVGLLALAYGVMVLPDFLRDRGAWPVAAIAVFVVLGTRWFLVRRARNVVAAEPEGADGEVG
ncbi:hypothetical protein GCM10022215_24570 [Nocardioides fonticola]|uniref:Uncharacterized protein n=1 Tax=Nocardioides fonticola TaxID=450363 RepID=A0ABP7XKU1_9ACTN